MADFSKKLNFADLWLRDSMQAWRTVPMFFESIDVDMSHCKALRRLKSNEAVPPTYTHMVVKATADTLASRRDFHKMICADREFFPDDVDISLPLGGDDNVAVPAIIIRAANRKTLADISAEVKSRKKEILEANQRNLAFLRRWGGCLPFGFLRRAVVRVALSRFRWRRNFVGTFQVTVAPADSGGTFMFATSAILCAGRIREKPAVVNHEIVARPMMTISCCADHRVWNGITVSRFLKGVKKRLESELH